MGHRSARTTMVDLKILHVAQGKAYADLAVIHGQIINVHPRKIYPGDVAVVGERMAVQGDIEYTIGPDTKVIDAEGHFIVPGFLEGFPLLRNAGRFSGVRGDRPRLRRLHPAKEG